MIFIELYMPQRGSLLRSVWAAGQGRRLRVVVVERALLTGRTPLARARTQASRRISSRGPRGGTGTPRTGGGPGRTLRRQRGII